MTPSSASSELDLDLKLNQPWRFDTNLLKLEEIPQGPFKVMGTLAQARAQRQNGIHPRWYRHRISSRRAM